MMDEKKNNVETDSVSEDDLIEETDESIEENVHENVEEIIRLKDKDIEDLNSQVIRLQADFVNFRKRAEKEKESTITYALESFICSLLPIVDNFQRAIESESEKKNSFYEGIDMIYKQLIKALEDNGVEEIKSLGGEFDPNLHHAVLVEENSEYDSGKVTEVLQKGYKLKDKVIRPSMVKVAK